MVALSDLGAFDQRGLGRVAPLGRAGATTPRSGSEAAGGRALPPRGLPGRAKSLLDRPALGNQRRRFRTQREQGEALVRQILTLLSFTLRIEPQLIRFVRRLLPAGRGEPGIESLGMAT